VRITVQDPMSVPDQNRFVALVDEHKGILYKVANAYCRGRDDRGDLVQEMFVQLWRSFDRYDERQRFSTWMYRVAMNVAISFYRKEWRRTRDVVALDDLGFDLAGADRALDESSDELRRLQERIKALDAVDRALILLYLDDYAHEAIGELMGLSATNVSTRIGRIKKKLQREGED
jgi:RNA polymerase sigma factor (sigma-70 family)